MGELVPTTLFFLSKHDAMINCQIWQFQFEDFILCVRPIISVPAVFISCFIQTFISISNSAKILDKRNTTIFLTGFCESWIWKGFIILISTFGLSCQHNKERLLLFHLLSIFHQQLLWTGGNQHQLFTNASSVEVWKL